MRCSAYNEASINPLFHSNYGIYDNFQIMYYIALYIITGAKRILPKSSRIYRGASEAYYIVKISSPRRGV